MKTTSYLGSALAAIQLVTLPLGVHAGTTVTETAASVTQEKAPPLPLHTIEGVGGIVITPVAYLVNPGPQGTTFGLPATSFTFVKANAKNVESAVLTETLFGRVELGYAASRFGVGNLVDDLRAVDLHINDQVVLHNFNIRVLALPENSFDLPLPAVTLGASYKYNDGINDIDKQTGGALSSVGLKRRDGVDYTLTATKAFPNVFGRTLIVTGGLRLSKAEQLGYLGFGNDYALTFEGNVVYLITNYLGLAGEFRGKANAYNQPVGDLVQREDNWWTVGAAYVINPHATVTVGWGHFGALLNTDENKGIAIQTKYEF